MLAPQAVEDLRNLRANMQAVVRDGIEQYLRHRPARTSRARIKRLRGLSRPQYRLRAEDVRVFHDGAEKQVEILAIVPRKKDERIPREQALPPNRMRRSSQLLLNVKDRMELRAAASRLEEFGKTRRATHAILRDGILVHSSPNEIPMPRAVITASSLRSTLRGTATASARLTSVI